MLSRAIDSTIYLSDRPVEWANVLAVFIEATTNASPCCRRRNLQIQLELSGELTTLCSKHSIDVQTRSLEITFSESQPEPLLPSEPTDREGRAAGVAVGDCRERRVPRRAENQTILDTRLRERYFLNKSLLVRRRHLHGSESCWASFGNGNGKTPLSGGAAP